MERKITPSQEPQLYSYDKIEISIFEMWNMSLTATDYKTSKEDLKKITTKSSHMAEKTNPYLSLENY